MKKIIIALALLTFSSCTKSQDNPTPTPNAQKTAVKKCWMCDYQWKELNGSVWYNFQEIVNYCDRDSLEMEKTKDSITYNLPNYISTVKCWKK